MHPAVKALIAWCVAGFAARFVQHILQDMLVGGWDVRNLPNMALLAMNCARQVPLSTAICLGIFVAALLVRMGLRRLLRKGDRMAAVSFAIATVLMGTVVLGYGLWAQFREGMISVVGLVFDLIVLSAPYGLAAFGVYWTVYRDPPQPDMDRVF